MSARTEFIQALRDLADFLEQNVIIPVPEHERSILVFVENADEFAQYARRMGYAEKDFMEGWVKLRKVFGLLSYDLTIEREKVCVKKVVGTREIPAYTEEIVEWTCTDSLLSGRTE